jgi:two-component system, NtrC family, response regulator HupR/HoxA
MRIIVVDDESANVTYLRRVLQNYQTESFVDPMDALDYCCANDFDLIIADQKMPGLSGIDLIRRIQTAKGDFLGIIISAYTDSGDLIDAVNSNVIYKYIVKPFTPDSLLQNVHRADENLSLQREKRRLEERLRIQNEALRRENLKLKSRSEQGLDDFIGYHSKIERLKSLSKMYALSEEPLLLTGETGTGKELIARGVHAMSSRRNGKFIALNCSAFSEQLLESEFFGYEKGAFTGAIRNKSGLVEEAEGGTLFLDEIGDFPPSFQSKILRFIQFGTFFPVGSTKEKQVNVRIIAATNRRLDRDVERGIFRKDLFYRLSSLHIAIPPLRERKEDILPLIEYIAAKRRYNLPRFEEEGLDWLLKYSFPGNVRELEGLLEKLNLHAAVHRTESISSTLIREILTRGMQGDDAASFPSMSAGEQEKSVPEEGDFDLQEYLNSVQKSIIFRRLNGNGGNISKTARELHLSRQGLKNKMENLGICINGEENGAL